MNPLDFIPKWLLVGALVAVGAFAGLQTWNLSEARGELVDAARDLQQAKDDVHALELAVADANERAATASKNFQRQVTEAENAAKKREIALRADRDAAVAQSDGLRDDLLTIRRGLAGLSEAAIRERADTLTELFDSCQRRYRGLAEKADRHASDVRTLMEAWPAAPASAP